jgi:hypothetical protein
MNKYRSSGLKPGDPISDTEAIIVALTKVRKYGDAELQSTALPEPKPTAYWGHYVYSWEEAVADFAERTKGWPIDNKYPPEVD